MNVTDVRVRKVNNEGKMKAIVSMTLDDEFVVHDIRVVEGQNGLFVAMPSRKTSSGEFRDVALAEKLAVKHIENAETRLMDGIVIND